MLPHSLGQAPTDLASAIELCAGIGIMIDADGLLGLVGAGLFPPVKLEGSSLLVSRAAFRQWSIENGHHRDGAA